MALVKKLAQKSLFYVMAAFISALMLNIGVYLKVISSDLNFFQQVGLFLSAFVISAVIVFMATRGVSS